MKEDIPMRMRNNKKMIVSFLKKWNTAYRDGTPIVTDSSYDFWIKHLKKIDPNHSWLHTIEPEKFKGWKVNHGNNIMLSTEKAYDIESLRNWINRIKKASIRINIDFREVGIRITPKLDGLAAKDLKNILSTRGNGRIGTDISHVFSRGVVAKGGRNLGVGEIVISKSYFDLKLSQEHDHPRSVVVGIIRSEKLKEYAKHILKDGAVHFVPYSTLDAWEGSLNNLIKEFNNKLLVIKNNIKNKTDYAIDGFVIEATDEKLKEEMSHTDTHHRWQIALKEKGDTTQVVVKNIAWQVGRTGKITPVINIDPVFLSGANISKITAHNAGIVKTKNIGEGATIIITRAGEVIPDFVNLITVGKDADIPKNCPSCSKKLTWKNDFLYCNSILCNSREKVGLQYFFKKLEIDGFGEKTIDRLYDQGAKTLERILNMKEQDFLEFGFSNGISYNLTKAITIRTQKKIEDWYFLAALGIEALGESSSKKLLAKMTIKELLNTNIEEILKIKGFAEKKSRVIHNGLKTKEPTIKYLEKTFNIIPTRLDSSKKLKNSPMYNKNILFTGAMKTGNRSLMQKQAENAGGNIHKTVTLKTNIVVTGENAGNSKLDRIKLLNKKGAKIKIIREQEWLNIIKNI